MKDFCWEPFEQLPYSSDLAQSDYHLFPQLKKELGWQHFQTQELIFAVTNICTTLGENFYCEGIEKFVTWYNRCLDRHGDYVEK